MDNTGKNIKKKEKPVKIPCIAKTANGDSCPNYGKFEQTQFSDKFCPKHHYQASLTQNEWEKLKLCSGCKSWKLMSGFNKNCDHCLEVGEKKRAKNVGKISKIYCSGVCRGNNECGRIVGKIGEFCDRHTFQSLYSKDELENMQECSGCKLMYSVKSFNGGKSCDKCKGRKGMVNEVNIVKEVLRTKPKSAKILGPCVMKTVSKQKCQNDGIIDINGQIFCKFHSGIVEEKNKLTKDHKKKCSSHYACGNLVELNGKYNTCEKCRKGDRVKSKGDRVKKQKIVIIEDGEDGEDCENDEEEELTSLSEECMNESVEKVVRVYKKDAFVDSEMERERDKLRLARKKSDELNLLEKFIDEKGLGKDNDKVNKVDISKTTNKVTELNILNKIVEKRNNKLNKDVDLDMELIDEKKELEGIDLTGLKLSSCAKCGREFPMFLNKKGLLSSKCEHCLGMQRKVEASRGVRKRDWKGELDKNPDRKAKKDKWKDKNADKVAMYDVNAKAKKIETLGIDKVREIRNETTSKWRGNNPDKVYAANLKKKGDPKERLKSIKYTAQDKGINFNISDEYAIKVVTSRCMYCNGKNKDSVNGIDRIDSNKGYTYDNTVSCCSHCNVCVKNTTDVLTMLNKIEHILHHNKLIDNGSYQWEYCLNNIIKRSYSYYQISAQKRNKEFSLTWEEIQNIIKNPCYICGKNYEDSVHYNGIDRFDNSLGYILENSKSCCGHCNIIKGSMKYDDLLQKIKRIYEKKNAILCIIKITGENGKIYDMDSTKRDTQIRKYQKSILDIIDYYKNNKVDKLVVNYKRQKPTKEEKLMNNKERKKKSDDKLKQKYGDKEYLQLRSLRNGLSRNRKELNNIKDSTEYKHIKRTKVLTDAIDRMENEIKELNKE